MAKDVEVGVAGSLTMIVLFSSIALLLRSFYQAVYAYESK
jgi:hypothetical protein